MDDIDIRILEILNENARISLSDLSSLVNLSIPAISERIKKLEKSKAIEKYTIKLNHQAFDLNLHCYCLLRLGSKGMTDKVFFEYVKNQPEIIDCHCITGDYEYLMKIITRDTITLEKLLVDLRNECGVIRTNSIFILSSVKDSGQIDINNILKEKI